MRAAGERVALSLLARVEVVDLAGRNSAWIAIKCARRSEHARCATAVVVTAESVRCRERKPSGRSLRRALLEG